MAKIKLAIIVFFVLLGKAGFAENLSAKILNPIVVTANPLGHSAEELTQPLTLLSGNNLLKKIQPTIGETLSQELGVNSTYYGPNASRPVIRGLDGDQIEILQNGVSNLDASATSVDHNLSIDPLSVEAIEVVRGPAALLYGSKAGGGVVNVIDNRIPSQPIIKKITGTADGRYNSANNERSGSILLEGGFGNYAWHVNGFKRITDDLKIPSFARSRILREQEPFASNENEPKGKLFNSQSNSDGSVVGISKFFKKGYFGLAFTNYNSSYGTVAEPDVTIDMKQQRIDIAGVNQRPVENIKEIKYKLGVSNYEHTEFEGSKTGTIFKNRGYDSRIEIIHNKFGLFEGVIGLQSKASDFSSLGQEAFLPSTNSKNNSAFIFEEAALGNLRLQLGGRFDYQMIKADKDSFFNVNRSRNDPTVSGSIGLIYNPIKGYVIAIAASYTEKAPNAQELYANGPHVATNSFEIGNKNLDIQKSKNFDISLRKEFGLSTGEINFFYNQFQNFISLVADGVNDLTFNLPIYNYANLPAEFYGAEAKINFTTYDDNIKKLGFEIHSDYVEARNAITKKPLPRISPMRIGIGVVYHYQKFGLNFDSNYIFSQNHISEFERPTDSYLMLNLGADYKLDIGSTNSLLYFKLTNLLNKEARNHISFLKDIAPFAERSIMIGIRSYF